MSTKWLRSTSVSLKQLQSTRPKGHGYALDRHHRSPTTFQIEGSKRVVESVVNWCVRL